MKQKINLRLSFIAFIAILATALGSTLVFYKLFQQQIFHDLKTSAELLEETGVFPMENKGKAGDFQASLAKVKPGIFRVTWISEDGRVLFDNDTDAKRLANHKSRPEILKTLERGEGKSIRQSDSMGLNTFYYARKLGDGSILRVSMEAKAITSVFMASLPVILLTGVLVLSVCVLIGRALTRQLIKPLDLMAEQLDDGPDKPVYKELEPFADKIRSQHEKILAAAKMRQDFTANVSHELKTPLTAISGYAELIEHGMTDQESEVHMARQIQKNAGHLLRQINDIIRLSEMDHKELHREFQQIDLLRLAQESCKGLQVAAGRKLIKLTCSGTAAGIKGDPDLIREMIDNLVQNAITYNRDYGEVQVHVGVENGHSRLSVRDTGLGIPADEVGRIFERFYRVDKSRSRERGGTGLGLSIVKHILEIHDASIEVDSSLGQGTTVHVKF